MQIKEFTCTGCSNRTLSGFDLSGKRHIECSGEIGEWQTSVLCNPGRHEYYIVLLDYIFCPYCGERLTPRALDGALCACPQPRFSVGNPSLCIICGKSRRQ